MKKNLEELAKMSHVHLIENKNSIKGGNEIIRNSDGTWTYTGSNELVYAFVAAHNAVQYLVNLF